MIIVHDENSCTISLYHEEVRECILEITYLIEHDAQVVIDFLLLYIQITIA